MTVAIFASSDGWKRRGPKSSQRRAVDLGSHYEHEHEQDERDRIQRVCERVVHPYGSAAATHAAMNATPHHVSCLIQSPSNCPGTVVAL